MVKVPSQKEHEKRFVHRKSCCPKIHSDLHDPSDLIKSNVLVVDPVYIVHIIYTVCIAHVSQRSPQRLCQQSHVLFLGLGMILVDSSK